MDASDRRARATEEATQWWSRLGTKPPAEVSEKDREEFTQWLRESQLHVAELLHVAHVHDAMERFTLWDEIPLEPEADGNNVQELPVAVAGAAGPGAGTRHGGAGPASAGVRNRRWRTGLLVAASISLITVAVGWLALFSGVQTLQTERAERREVVLNDGSVVNLDPETQLRMELGRQQRSVALLHGRALFQVAKDPSRPFVVRAGDTQVRVVGTTFGVEQGEQSTIITVSEGKVEAGSSKVADAPNVFLTANQQITVRKSGGAAKVRQVDSSRALAWSQGRLIFDSTPLSEVTAEFNRYNRVQLQINSPELAQRTVSGVFKASDPQTLIDFISAGARVVVTRKGDEEVVISQAP